jgi:hypothetical protein
MRHWSLFAIDLSVVIQLWPVITVTPPERGAPRARIRGKYTENRQADKAKKNGQKTGKAREK